MGAGEEKHDGVSDPEHGLAYRRQRSTATHAQLRTPPRLSPATTAFFFPVSPAARLSSASLICSARVMYVFIFARMALFALSFFTYFRPERERERQNMHAHTTKKPGTGKAQKKEKKQCHESMKPPWGRYVLSSSQPSPLPSPALTGHEISESLTIERQCRVQLIVVVRDHRLLDDLHPLLGEANGVGQRRGAEEGDGRRRNHADVCRTQQIRRVRRCSCVDSRESCFTIPLSCSYLGNECVVHAGSRRAVASADGGGRLQSQEMQVRLHRRVRERSPHSGV